MRTILANKIGGEVAVHFNSNGTLSLADVQLAGETVKEIYITQAAWGSGGGTTGPSFWRVSRNGQTVLVLDSTAYKEFAGNGLAIRMFGNQPITVELVGALDGYLILELQKVSDIANNQYLRG